MDYGKWKYQQKKKEQKAKSHTKQSEMKGIRLRPNIGDHDLDIKVDHAGEFLEDGHKVQFTMIFRGRQMAHRDLAMQAMNNVATRLGEISKVETPARMMGRRMTMVLAPEKTGGSKPSKPKSKPKPKPKPEAEAAPQADDAPADNAASTETSAS